MQDFDRRLDEENTYGDPIEPEPEPIQQPPVPLPQMPPKAMVPTSYMYWMGIGGLLIGIALTWFFQEFEWVKE